VLRARHSGRRRHSRNVLTPGAAFSRFWEAAHTAPPIAEPRPRRSKTAALDVEIVIGGRGRLRRRPRTAKQAENPPSAQIIRVIQNPIAGLGLLEGLDGVDRAGAELSVRHAVVVAGSDEIALDGDAVGERHGGVGGRLRARRRRLFFMALCLAAGAGVCASADALMSNDRNAIPTGRIENPTRWTPAEA
jgi:hypothetical protein